VTSIKHLGLYNTYLYGPFPDALGSMTALQELDFSDNGNAATITVDLKSLCHLERLWLDSSLSSGNITDFFENLPACTSHKLLQELRLGDNFMFGSLPNRMRQYLTSLSRLSLFNNNITGAIPAGIHDCTNLQSLDLSSNHLTGAIPSWIGDCTNLQSLDLSGNHLTRAIPQGIGNCTDLVHLDLTTSSMELYHQG
jgi:Leucine-rich repeat (LRR) protein